MIPEAWNTLAVVGGAALTAVGAWAAARVGTAKAETEATSAKTAAEEAARLSAPTGNGFAGHVLGSLEQLTTSIHDVVEAIDRIERRQTADAVAGRKTAELLGQHLNDHARSGLVQT